jgi:alcohol dehydrogenase (NADP+)
LCFYQLDIAETHRSVHYRDLFTALSSTAPLTVHWPVASKRNIDGGGPTEFYSLQERPISETWRGMEECVTAGLTKGIGVSNFSVKKLQSLLDTCTIPPAIDQVERHPFFPQSSLLKFCQAKNIHLTCYSPLGSMDRPAQFKAANEPLLLQSPIVLDIAQRMSITPAQVILKWAIQQGTSTIPKSVNPHRLVENLAAASLPDLSVSDMDAMASLGAANTRLLDGSFWTTPTESPYTLANLWDED